MKNRNHKKIAPIIITVIMIIYYAAYFAWIVSLIDRSWAILLGIIPLLLAGVMLYVCMQRIDEIDSGEEDDLDQY